MGVTIRATATSVSPIVRSSLEHAVIAARNCIWEAGIVPEQIDTLINVGLYRDSNMVEPAMSTLIQRAIGMNPDYLKTPTLKPGLSFDLMNSACGVLNSIQVADALLEAGNEYVLVVASDAHPSNCASGPGGRRGFPYATLGAAMLLEYTDREEFSFRRVRAELARAASSGLAGYLDFSASGPHGRDQISVVRQRRDLIRLADATAAAVDQYLRDEKLDMAMTRLVTSRPTPKFGAELARRLGMNNDAVVDVKDVTRDPGSAALILGYHQALERAEDIGYDHMLFVGAGAGLTIACAAYPLLGGN